MTATTTAPATGAENIHWDLTHLYTNPEAGVDADLSRSDEMALTFERAYRGRVGQLSPAEVAVALRELEEIEEVIERAAAYAQLNFTTDTADPARGAMLQKVQEIATQVGTKLIFFNLEWIAVDDQAAELILADPAVENYRHYLRSARRYRPYVLSEPEEKILAEKSVTARAAWDRLFDEACSAIRVQLGGEEVGLEQALSKLYSHDAEERRRVAQAVTEALKVDLRTRRFIYNTVLADKQIDDRLRSYPHWVADRNLANEASDESYAALVEAVTSRYDITHRYYALKKRLLKLDQMNDWDRYAPVGGEEPAVSYDEARDIVLDAYGSFSPKLRELAAEFFEKNWIDAALAPNKRGGAFAHPVSPSLHPYVMLNFTGTRRDVLVMAHELGHGVHMSLSRSQTALNYGTPLTLAETASIFGETVTFGRLLSAEHDPARRLSLLIGRLDDAAASIFRQIAMNRFEDRIHTERRAHGELSGDQINTAWLETSRAMLGPAVDVSENYGIWWSYIHHMVGVPGYVYAYAFGNLLALAVYKQSEKEGAESFATKYFDLLSAGGSDSPEALAAKVGLDLTDPRFWHGGLDTLSELIDEAEDLAGQVG